VNGHSFIVNELYTIVVSCIGLFGNKSLINQDTKIVIFVVIFHLNTNVSLKTKISQRMTTHTTTNSNNNNNHTKTSYYIHFQQILFLLLFTCFLTKIKSSQAVGVRQSSSPSSPLKYSTIAATTSTPSMVSPGAAAVLSDTSPPPPPLVTDDEISQGPRRANVLLIVADDLRVDYDSLLTTTTPTNNNNKRIHTGGDAFRTPNIERIAKTGVTFDDAHTTFSVCGPSRASFLTGRSPESHTMLSYVAKNWRDAGGARVSLPQHLKRNGWTTSVVGKVFHNDDVDGADPLSWSWLGCTSPFDCGEFKCPQNQLSCKCDFQCVDSNYATMAVNRLQKIKNDQAEPFFLAVGFRRPHFNWCLPPGWIDQQGLNNVDIPQPSHPAFPSDTIPVEAFYACDNLVVAPETKAQTNAMSPNSPIGFTSDLTANLRKMYWSSSKYMDMQIGRVLDAVDSLGFTDRTLVIFLSDHGWNLGERNMWCKQSLFNTVTRVPYIFRIPWIPRLAGTRVSDRRVSTLSLFKTVTQLLQVDKLDGEDRMGLYCVQGQSVFDTSTPSPTFSHDDMPITQFPRCFSTGNTFPYSDACGVTPVAQFDLMGYSIKNKGIRYTEWRKWLGVAADWSPSGLVSTELYDHSTAPANSWLVDSLENVNLVKDPRYSAVVKEMVNKLHNKIQNGYITSCPATPPVISAPTSSVTAQPTLPPSKKSGTSAPSSQSQPSSPPPTSLPPTSSPVPETEPVSGLMPADISTWKRIYDSTNGPNWISCNGMRKTPCQCGLKNDKKVPGDNPGSNVYVTCRGGRITHMSLPHNNLVGYFPILTGNLTALTKVNLTAGYENQQGANIIYNAEPCLNLPVCWRKKTTCIGVNYCPPPTCTRFSRNMCRSLKTCLWIKNVGCFDTTNPDAVKVVTNRQRRASKFRAIKERGGIRGLMEVDSSSASQLLVVDV
jgi:iduronate 2-sulfatase